jgi:hypothetical protein
MQTKNDGKHAILPVAERSDHARVPVIMPRESDRELRRDGSETVQPDRLDSMKRPVDECGRLHGAPELDPKAKQRIVEKSRVEFSNAKEKRRCRKSSPTATRLRRLGPTGGEHDVALAGQSFEPGMPSTWRTPLKCSRCDAGRSAFRSGANR